MHILIFRMILIIGLSIIGLTGCAGMSVSPDVTTLKYGQTDQTGDSINGAYDSNNFVITQTFKWSK